METRKQILVLGGDSAIGKALAEGLSRDEHFELSATTRRRKEPARSFFDAHDAHTWNKLPDSPAAAFFCFGNTSLKECESNPGETRAINVEATLDLAQKYATQGTHVIFFSTSLVFEGKHPLSGPETEIRPQGEYARQKAETEERLLKLAGMVTVLRITKFLESLDSLMRQWMDELRAGEPVQPFHDRLICPFDRNLLCAASAGVIRKEVTGILHLSGEADISYHLLAAWVAEAIGARAELLDPISARDLALEPEPRFAWPPWTSLDMARSEKELGILPTPLSRVRKHIKALAAEAGGNSGMEKTGHE